MNNFLGYIVILISSVFIKNCNQKLFYIYPDNLFDNENIISCLTKLEKNWISYRRSEDLGELFLTKLAKNHPNRTNDIKKADVLIIPLLISSSALIGQCNGKSHETRIQEWKIIIENLEPFRQNNGRKHFILCHQYNCLNLLGSIKNIIKHVTIGYFENRNGYIGKKNNRCSIFRKYVL